MLELFILAIAPALFILWYVYRKDSYEPEPLHQVVRVFLLGAFVVIPAALIESPFPSGIITSSVVAPVVEELLKFSVVFFFVYRLPEFNEPVDGIVYAAAAGLGFAAVENIVYVLDGGIAVGIIRAVASVPGHMIFSCTWGFALGIAKFRSEPSARGGIITAGVAGAILLHGVFNFSLEYFEVAGLLFILFLLIPLGWWFTRRNIRTAHADPASVFSSMQKSSAQGNGIPPIRDPEIVADPVPARPQQHNQIDTIPAHQKRNRTTTAHFCTNCGTQFTDGIRFCVNCGKEL
ncbi:MAG: PrsW family glutamic-type intramembrane protease [Methanoregula sp.]|jgi:RsiW-degrading membrane proteinase PrsW (M82 family)|nr:PrsW family glutamic-type intramembrane protease [Methanoregula sp.]